MFDTPYFFADTLRFKTHVVVKLFAAVPETPSMAQRGKKRRKVRVSPDRFVGLGYLSMRACMHAWGAAIFHGRNPRSFYRGTDELKKKKWRTATPTTTVVKNGVFVDEASWIPRTENSVELGGKKYARSEK